MIHVFRICPTGTPIWSLQIRKLVVGYILRYISHAVLFHVRMIVFKCVFIAVFLINFSRLEPGFNSYVTLLL